ncbi:MAG: hypothetical protein WCX65_20240 [bacterium]
MPSTVDIIIGLFLSYYWTGFEMVSFHSQQHPVDRPGYVSDPIFRRILSGAIWPVVAKLNNELAWFFVCFFSGVVVFSFLHALAYPYFGSTGIVVLAIAILRSIPGVAVIVNAPLALLAMALWMILAKPFGAKIPSGMERIQRK